MRRLPRNIGPRTTVRLLLAMASSALFTSAAAHELMAIRSLQSGTEVGMAARVAIDISARPNVGTCGLNVDFGDGTQDYLQVRGPNPSGTIQHSYAQPGTAVIRIEGKIRFRGLNSTLPCTGTAQVTTVQVYPAGYAARRAAAQAERQATAQREQQAQQDALQRAQNETRAAQAETQRQRALADQALEAARNERNNAQRLAAAHADQLRATRSAAVVAAVSHPPASAPQLARPNPDKPKAKSAFDL